ncbi:MAG: MerR family transcriptional regulator [Alphaproteobacteria bacterium]|nr:MerR family transcriptional regulator [Alphaproteobacteria bacterium]
MNEQLPIKSYSLAELCVMADLQLRTVRYYIQIGLVDRPQGSTRAAAYGEQHLEQLLLIKKWTTAGVSLNRIRELLQGADAPVPPRPVRSGQIEVRSHILITDGLEVVIDPSRAGLTTDEVRDFVKGVMAAYESVMEKKAKSLNDSASSTDQKS